MGTPIKRMCALHAATANVMNCSNKHAHMACHELSVWHAHRWRFQYAVLNASLPRPLVVDVEPLSLHAAQQLAQR